MSAAGAITIRHATRADVELLRKLNSPLIAALDAGRKQLRRAAFGIRTKFPKPPPLSTEQGLEALYILMVATEQAAVELESGREFFRECATAATVDSFSVEQISAVLESLGQRYAAVVIQEAKKA